MAYLALFTALLHPFTRDVIVRNHRLGEKASKREAEMDAETYTFG
jgi:hypothetical protein